MQGGRFYDGMISGIFASFAGNLASTIKEGSVGLHAIIGAAIGGTAETLGGGKFANGAITGFFVGMFNHCLHQSQIKEVDQLSYPDAVDLNDPNAAIQLLEWAEFIEKNNLRDIKLGRIIDFTTLSDSYKTGGGDRFRGLLKFEDGFVKWNTLGLAKTGYYNDVQGVTPKQIGKNYYIVFEGIPISGNSSPMSLFELNFNNYSTFENAFYKVWGNEKEVYFIE